MFQKYEIVFFKKIHYNVFLEYIENPKEFAPKLVRTKTQNWLFKKRPAIIWQVYKHESGDKMLTRYLVIPLTSKNSIDHWIDGTESLRILLENKNLKDGFSFLMLDSIMTITEKDVIDLYNNNHSRIKLTGGQIRYLRAQLSIKMGNLFNVPIEEDKLSTSQ